MHPITLLLLACAGREPAPPAEPTASEPVAPEEPAVPEAPQPIVVVGTAQNAKLGAAVVSGGGVYYVRGLSEWDATLVGQEVSVRGIVVESPAEPLVNEKGEVSAGASGPTSWIESATWKAASD